MWKVVEKRDERQAGAELLLLDEIAREGARGMLIAAMRAEAVPTKNSKSGEKSGVFGFTDAISRACSRSCDR